jgi:UDP-N-acetylmuramoyl-tripeptide--D-alanyl-D-alanine ligase
MIILLTNPFAALGLSLLILKPYEVYKKRQTINITKEKINSLNKLQIIGITGSFGKTSTKEILYQILKNKYKTLKTPESYNTLFGIAKVVDLELDNTYEYFICEMAAYKIGEINELCNMIPPKFGILTGITTQHFEKFGSLKNTIKAKFELVDGINNIGNIIFNLDDLNIKSELAKRGINYPSNTLSTKNIQIDKSGSYIEFLFNGKTYKVKTKLFGLAHIKNILIAANMALKLGLPMEYIISQISKLDSIDNRQVLQIFGKSVIVNNTYSSNPQGFTETIETAKLVKGKKALVTPGLVELGKLEKQIHLDLGKKAKGVFNKVILVGENARTKSFASGVHENFEFINDTRENYSTKLEEIKEKYDWIFLENDLTQNY